MLAQRGPDQGSSRQADCRTTGAGTIARSARVAVSDDVAAAHDHDVAIRRGGPSLIDRSLQIGCECESHTQASRSRRTSFGGEC
jgi:hypothetical protein